MLKKEINNFVSRMSLTDQNESADRHKQLHRRSSLKGLGPTSEEYRSARRILPPSGKHLVAAFSAQNIYVYVNCTQGVAHRLKSFLQRSRSPKGRGLASRIKRPSSSSRVRQLNSRNSPHSKYAPKRRPQTARSNRDRMATIGYVNSNEDYVNGPASAFGVAGVRVHVKLDFLDAAYSGSWSKPETQCDSSLQTIGLCLSRPFFDLLLRKCVLADALPSICSEKQGEYISVAKRSILREDYCALTWNPPRSFSGQVLLNGPSFLGLEIGGGWLRRMLTYGDGLVHLLSEREMGRYLDQYSSLSSLQRRDSTKFKLRNFRVPKQRHYQPGAPRPPHPRLQNPDVKWSSPQWRPGVDPAGRKVDTLVHTNSGLSPWGAKCQDTQIADDADSANEAERRSPLCDLCFLMDHHFDSDRKSVLRRGNKAGVGSLVLLPSGSSIADMQILLKRCRGQYRPNTSTVAETIAEATASLKDIDSEKIGESNVAKKKPRSLTRADTPGKKLFGLSEDTSMEAELSSESKYDKTKNYAKVNNDVAIDNAYSIITGAAIGVHPHDATLWLKARDKYESLARINTNVAAIGVIGLDFQRLLTPVAEQKVAFQEQLKLAKQLQVTAIVTEHWASEEMMATLSQVDVAPAHVLLLGFNGSEEQAQSYLDCHPGLYIGLNGSLCQNENGRLLRGMLRNKVLPLDRLIVYSGAPFNHPGTSRRKKWKRCEPLHVRRIIKKVAKCIGGDIDVSEVEEILAINHAILFGVRSAINNAVKQNT